MQTQSAAADPVADILRKSPLAPQMRAELWDVFEASKDEDDLAERLKALKVPDQVKAGLWDLKHNSSQDTVTLRISSDDGPTDPADELTREAGVSAYLHPIRPRIGMFDQVYGPIVDAGIGAAKGALKTAVGLGEAVYDHLPGVKPVTDAVAGKPDFDATKTVLDPSNTAQKVGQSIEQIAEFFVPGAKAEKWATAIASKLPQYTRIFPHMAAQSAAGAGVASVQGNDPTAAAIGGAVIPAVGGSVVAGARWVGSKAEPLIRAAIKPTVTSMKRVAGASREGLDAKAEQLVKFLVENRVTTAKKAHELFLIAENELRRVLAGSRVATDAPQRAARYLSALERSARKQGLGADDAATVRNAAAELLEGPMGEDIVQMVPVPHPTLVQPNGQPVTVLTPKTTRALRTDVGPEEALDSARASGQWGTRKQWGEQKGATIEAKKAVERGQRDAVKAAVPEAAPLLKREELALRSEEVLDRMAFRQANRDAVSLPAHVMAAGEIASGRVPMLAFAANWLRNNQMKAGIWADVLRKAIERKDVQMVDVIMRRLGVGAASQAAPAK